MKNGMVEFVSRSTVKRIAAFTLIEFIVCIAVIGVIASLIAGATVRSKDQAFRASNMQRLKQLATATVIYADQYSDYPYTKPAEALTDAGLVKDASLFASRFDPLPEGVANPTEANQRIRFKVSDFHPFQPDRKTLNFIRSNGMPYGLYADSTIGTRNYKSDVQNDLLYFIGTYQRVQNDTSVIVRSQFPVPYATGTACLSYRFYLTEMSHEQQIAFCRSDRR